MPRKSWLDETDSPLIDDYAQQLGPFLDAVADGRIDNAELKSQEGRVVALMKEVEPQLDDALHEKITQLLCELTAYDIMQLMNELKSARGAKKLVL